MAGPHGHESSHGHGHGHGHGKDGHGSSHSPPKHGHGGSSHPPKHGHGEHGDCKPKPSAGGGGNAVPIDDNPTATDGPYPEVIGLSPTEATAIVKQKVPNATVDVVPGGETRPTLASVPNTVRLWLDHAGKVQIVEIPELDATATGGGSSTTGGGNTVPIDDNPTAADGPYPEVIGLSPAEATAVVKQKSPDATVEVIPGGEIRPTLASAPNTVRLWLDHAGKVQIVEIPEVDAAATGGGGSNTGGGHAVPIDDNPTAADGPYPEVIGLSPAEATAIVKQKAPDATIDIVPGGETRPTLASVPNTVRLWLDHAGKVQLVSQPPVTAT